MGCGASAPAASEQASPTSGSAQSNASKSQPQIVSIQQDIRASSTDRRNSLGKHDDDEFDQRRMSRADKVDTTSMFTPNSSSDRDPASSTPSQLSSRKSLVGTSGSLGSKLERSLIIPQGWGNGKAVAIRIDPRITHICSLACSIVKVPVVFVITHEAGRTIVTASKALDSLGPKHWLSHFTQWLFAQALSPEMTIEDTQSDPRARECPWVIANPLIRFVMAAEFYKISDNSVRLGVLVALDLQPHPGATGSAMLGNLANMAAREVDAPNPLQQPVQEFYTDGVPVGRLYRKRVDDYIWVTFLLDATKPRWTIQHVNNAFHGMTGIPPGCVEGFDFWDYVHPLRSTEEEPWRAVEAELQKNSNFYLPPVTFQAPHRSSDGKVNNAKQIYRVEMRPYTEVTSTTYEVEGPEFNGQYFACFQPDARFSLDINSTAPAIPEDLPFPGLELGPVIGKGSFGYVCKGALGNVIVAVKIIEASAIAKVSNEGLPMEVYLSKNLRHRNIVKMLDYATRVRKAKLPSRQNSMRASGTGMASSAGSIESAGANTGNSSLKSRGGTPFEALNRDTTGGTLEAWLLIEYCDRGSLQDGMDMDLFGSRAGAAQGGLPDMLALLQTAYEVAAAMRYLHTHNILHGDLTSGNVLLASQKPSTDDSRGYTAKVADFGLSRESLTSKVETNSFGTVTHMPPELLNDGILSKHADVYAFGVLLVEMFLGERSFTGMRQPQIIHTIAVLKKHPELPTRAPAFLQELTRSCMQENAKERPSFDAIMGVLRPHVQFG